MKVCPHCKKEIPDRAVKCKYCRKVLDMDYESEQLETKTKSKKVLTVEENKELEKLEEFYNENVNSSIEKRAWYLVRILLFILSFVIDNDKIILPLYIVLFICFSICVILSSIILYKQTINYIEYTWINVQWWALSYWIPITHYTSSPEFVKKIINKFRDDKRFSKYIVEDWKIAWWVNLLYSFLLCFILYIIVLYFLNPDIEYFNLSNTNDWLNYFSAFLAIVIPYAIYIGQYQAKLDIVNDCIKWRISEIKWENED